MILNIFSLFSLVSLISVSQSFSIYEKKCENSLNGKWVLFGKKTENNCDDIELYLLNKTITFYRSNKLYIIISEISKLCKTGLSIYDTIHGNIDYPKEFDFEDIPTDTHLILNFNVSSFEKRFEIIRKQSKFQTKIRLDYPELTQDIQYSRECNLVIENEEYTRSD